MLVVKKIDALKKHFKLQKAAGKTVGFVPTMGALHQGHLSLVERAKKENDLVVCSVFVNPIQFDKQEDLQKYPRDIEQDKQLLEQAGCDVLFFPSVEEMYPEPVKTKYDFGSLDKHMEGKFRRGHFNGVAIVVKKLFEIVEPNRAYFGQKDFQQLAIIKKLVEMEQLPVDVVSCATVRETSGLAMSSRNLRLSEQAKKDALIIYESLKKAREMAREKKLSPHEVEAWAKQQFKASNLELEYFQIVDAKSLESIEKWSEGEEIVACAAAWINGVRLIDNMILNP